MKLAVKIAVVTGAGLGIGHEAAKLLASEAATQNNYNIDLAAMQKKAT